MLDFGRPTAPPGAYVCQGHIQDDARSEATSFPTLRRARGIPFTLVQGIHACPRNSGDPPQDPGSAVHHRASWRDPRGRRPPTSRVVGRRVRGACAASLREGTAGGRPSTSGDRSRARLGAGGGQLGSGPHGGWPFQRGGTRPSWGSTARRIRCRPGCGGRACGGPRARRRGLCDPRGASGRDDRQGRGGWPPGMPMAASPTSRRDQRSCARRSATAQCPVLVCVRVLTWLAHGGHGRASEYAPDRHTAPYVPPGA